MSTRETRACGQSGTLKAAACTPKSAGVAAHVLALSKDVTLHGALDVLLGGAGFEVEFGVERIKLEKVTMQFSRWRTGTTITDFAEVVAALACAIGGLFCLREILWELAETRR